MAGIRPPWSIRWLMIPLLPFVLIFWMAVLYDGSRKLIKEKLNSYHSLLTLLGLVLSFGFVLTPYGDDPSGRYFLPFLIPMSIFGGELIATSGRKRRYLEIGMITFLIVYQLGGTIQAAMQNPPGLTTQYDQVAQVDHTSMNELIEFLEINEIYRGYSNYWVSYPLAFLSREEIIFIPRLPYHEDFRYTERDDRYQPYTDLVKSADTVAYITTRHPELDEYLQEQFKYRDITWQQERIGDYTVYYHLSSSIHAEDIGLGVTIK